MSTVIFTLNDDEAMFRAGELAADGSIEEDSLEEARENLDYALDVVRVGRSAIAYAESRDQAKGEGWERYRLRVTFYEGYVQEMQRRGIEGFDE